MPVAQADGRSIQGSVRRQYDRKLKRDTGTRDGFLFGKGTPPVDLPKMWGAPLPPQAVLSKLW